MQTKGLSPAAMTLLDMLRFVSAEVVVVGHALSFFRLDGYVSPPTFPYMQNIAVVVFFVVSGFIICFTTLQKKEGDTSFKAVDYFVDRASRIYVTLVPALLFVFVADLLGRLLFGDAYAFGSADSLAQAAGNLLHLQDHPAWTSLQEMGVELRVTSYGSARPLWTLAIECWLYVAFGLVCLRWPDSVILKGLFAIAGVSAGWVIWENALGGRGHGLATIWALGAFAAMMLLRATITTLVGIALALAGFVLFTLRLSSIDSGYDILANIGLAATCVGALYVAQNSRRYWPGAAQILSYGASFSFTLYVTHYTICYFCLLFFGEQNLAGLATAIITSNVIAVVFAHSTEHQYRQVRTAVRQIQQGYTKSNPGGRQ